MTDLLRRAWDALDSFKQAHPESWHEEDEQVLKELMWADLKLSGVQREWVGLTEEEYQDIRYGSDDESGPYVDYTIYEEGDGYEEIEIYVEDFAKAIEAKLREKNGG